MEKWEHLRISLADIKHATNGFQKEIIRGGYGSVYEGELAFKGKLTKIAVKKLNEKHGQGLKEFLTEIDLLSGQQHENIITLIGYCDEGKEMIIVYEHAEHGSLDQYIRCSNTSKYTLTWMERLKIVVQVARGLDHLHNHLNNKQVIIHRDIKSSNILLDHNWVAKISDLGLSKSTFSGFDRTTVISHACGTMGYVEPEYIRYGFVSTKSDVYSFGMVLFEVLCGRLCTIRDNDGILLLADVAKEHYKEDKLNVLIDPSLRKQMSLEVLSRYSAIAYKCLLGRKDRPPMDDVKKELEEMLKLETRNEELRRIKNAWISSEENIVSDEYLKKLTVLNRSPFGGAESSSKVVSEEFVPTSAWTEDSTCHYLLVDLPGFKKQELKLQVDNQNHILVSGERHVREKKYTRFRQRFDLPKDADIEKITGKLDAEILYISFPKKVGQEHKDLSEPAPVSDA